jgi:hypothetical protein
MSAAGLSHDDEARLVFVKRDHVLSVYKIGKGYYNKSGIVVGIHFYILNAALGLSPLFPCRNLNKFD